MVRIGRGEHTYRKNRSTSPGHVLCTHPVLLCVIRYSYPYHPSSSPQEATEVWALYFVLMVSSILMYFWHTPNPFCFLSFWLCVLRWRNRPRWFLSLKSSQDLTRNFLPQTFLSSKHLIWSNTLSLPMNNYEAITNFLLLSFFQLFVLRLHHREHRHSRTHSHITPIHFQFHKHLFNAPLLSMSLQCLWVAQVYSLVEASRSAQKETKAPPIHTYVPKTLSLFIV